MNLHNQIMNLPCLLDCATDGQKQGYAEGHRDARHAAAELALQAEQDRIDAERYRKLQRWMSSNVQEGWREVENMAALCCYQSWEDMNQYLDDLPVCNVGLCYVRENAK